MEVVEEQRSKEFVGEVTLLLFCGCRLKAIFELLWLILLWVRCLRILNLWRVVAGSELLLEKLGFNCRT